MRRPRRRFLIPAVDGQAGHGDGGGFGSVGGNYSMELAGCRETDRVAVADFTIGGVEGCIVVP